MGFTQKFPKDQIDSIITAVEKALTNISVDEIRNRALAWWERRRGKEALIDLLDQMVVPAQIHCEFIRKSLYLARQELQKDDIWESLNSLRTHLKSHIMWCLRNPQSKKKKKTKNVKGKASEKPGAYFAQQ